MSGLCLASGGGLPASTQANSFWCKPTLQFGRSLLGRIRSISCPFGLTPIRGDPLVLRSPSRPSPSSSLWRVRRFRFAVSEWPGCASGSGVTTPCGLSSVRSLTGAWWMRWAGAFRPRVQSFGWLVVAAVRYATMFGFPRCTSSFGRWLFGAEGFGVALGLRYLVDPASSHMLVSKIKPCMSKYKQVCTVKLRMAH